MSQPTIAPPAPKTRAARRADKTLTAQPAVPARWALCSALLLAGCGAEVAGTAATVGRLQATQAEQAKAQQQKIQTDLGAALEAGKARTDAASQ